MIPTNPKAPNWMCSEPAPVPEQRKFNDRQYIGWFGYAPLQELSGWEENPRLDIPVEMFQDENFGRSPNNDELLDIMLDVSVSERTNDDQDDDEEDNSARRTRRNKLIELAHNIRINGVRVPLIVTYDKRIIDGNRRYYATLKLYRETDDPQVRRNFEVLPVWVLPSAVKMDDEDHILTELNAIHDCHVKWPYSVLARRIFNDYRNNKMDVEALSKKYHNYTKGRITTVIEASKVAAEFIEYHDDSLEAKDLAYRKLIWFDELRRSNGKAMEKADFRHTIYDLVLSDRDKFTSSADFKNLGAIYGHPDAWEILTTRKGKEALKQANFIVDRERYEGTSDNQSRLQRINNTLQNMLKGGGFGVVDSDVLARFHDLSNQVPGRRMTSEARARQLVDLLDGMTSQEMALLPDFVIERLGKTLERVTMQATAYRQEEE